jgi:hypothetical protein
MMPDLELIVLSLRYSSWSMRPWLALTQAGARFELQVVELPQLERRGGAGAPLQVGVGLRGERRALGSVTGSFPVLPAALAPYATALGELAAVQQLTALARRSPRMPVYDAYLRSLGGDPDALLAG